MDKQSLAWKYFTQELTIWKHLSPQIATDHQVHQAACLYACGTIMADEGKYAFARQYFEQALELRRGSLPPDHHDIAETLASLGNACFAQGDMEAADNYLKQALSLYSVSLGDEAAPVIAIRQSLHRMNIK